MARARRNGHFLRIVRDTAVLEPGSLQAHFVSWARMSRLPILLACLLLAVFAAACGDDEEEASAPQETATATATPEPTAGEVDSARRSARTSARSRRSRSRPATRRPSSRRSTSSRARARPRRPGDTVSVQYVGNSWSTGTQFDSSWDRGTEPFTFPLGAGQVIPGWDQGVAGMKKGGRRLLVIPPDLAYGAQSPSPDIGPNETLIFVVDLAKIG